MFTIDTSLGQFSIPYGGYRIAGNIYRVQDDGIFRITRFNTQCITHKLAVSDGQWAVHEIELKAVYRVARGLD